MPKPKSKVDDKSLITGFKKPKASLPEKKITIRENNIVEWSTDIDTSICQYCGGEAVFKANSEFIYGEDHGAVYVCEHYPECDAYVGTHKSGGFSGRPLGLMARKPLRLLRITAHELIDKLIVLNKKMGIQDAKKAVYSTLCANLRIPKEITHVGMMNENQVQECIHTLKVMLDGSEDVPLPSKKKKFD